MISQFNQPRGSTSIEVNKQSIARNFGVKEDEVIYFTVGIDLSGFKVIYDESTQRAYSLPSGIVSGTIAISLNEQAILTHSSGSVDLGELAVSREEYVTLPGSFNFGHTINVKNELLVHDDKKYRWDGSLPKVVAAGSTPDNSGGVGLGAWLSVGDVSLRADLASGTLGKGANLLTYKSQVSNSVAISQQIKNSERVSVFEYLAKPIPGFDNASAFAAMKADAEAGVVITVPSGVYETSEPLRFTKPVQIWFDVGVRIKLTSGAHDHVVEIDLRGQDEGYWGYKPFFGGGRVILDGLGHAKYGLSLRGVISGGFPGIQATNITTAGLYLAWTQCCTYTDFICSNNVEVFTTKPLHGILVDKDNNPSNPRGTSCDIFINPCVEHTAGDGFVGLSLMNSMVINGTIEGNLGAGISLGHPTDNTYTALGNTFLGIDLEVNTLTDIVINKFSHMNEFIGLKSGYSSPSVQVRGFRNYFSGGTVSDFDFRPDSHDNHVQDVTLLAEFPVVNDEGIRNTYERLWNLNNAQVNVSTNPVNTRSNQPIAGGETVTLDPYKASYVVCTATGTPINIVSATKKLDGARIDLTIHNASGTDSLVINWASDIRVGNFTPPPAGKHKGLSLRYDANYGYWTVVGVGLDALS
ncbi:hypothetical protein RLO43_002116 [Escherichia coli]|nr:hypothetical protein [Escherichia coli]